MKPLYLALSGGGAHAAAHAGVLAELEMAGIAVAGIAGVSGGAFVAAVWAGGGNLDHLVDEGSRLHPWLWVRGWGGGLLSGTRLGALVDDHLPAATFEELRVPLSVLCTDVDSGERVVFREGSLRDAVCASCSFPGFFPPYAWNGRRLVDGGVSEVVPVRVARDMGDEKSLVVAVDCNAGGKWPAAGSFVSIALRAGLTMLRGRTRSELAGADFLVAPPIGESGWMQPRKIPSFYDAGREAAREALPTLRALLEG